MVPTRYEANRNADTLRRLFTLGANGSDEAIKAFEKDRYLALSALGIYDYDMRHGDITFETPEVNQLLDYIETTYDLCFSPEAQIPDGAYYHRRGLESWMQKLAADKEAKAS
jgi:hypothetical protein